MDNYREAVMSYRNAQSKDEKRSMEQLISTIKNDFEIEVSKGDKRFLKLNKLNGELLGLTGQSSLFEMTKKQKEEWNKKVKKLTEEIRKYETELAEIKSNKIYGNAFEWRFEFPEVLNNEGNFIGFDVIIGNPPYGIDLADSEKIFIRNNFLSMEGDFDTYQYFLEKSLLLLSTDSSATFIVPNNLLLQKFGRKIRKILIEQTEIYVLIDIGLGVFEDAVVPTMIIGFKKTKPKLDHHTNYLYRPINHFYNEIFKKILQTSFGSNEDFKFVLNLTDKEIELVSKIKSKGILIKKICEIKIGIECDQKYINNSPVSKISKPLVRGRNFTKYYINFETDPKYVEYDRKLLHRAREERLFTIERKILIRQTGDKIIATIDCNKLYAWKSVFVALPDEKIVSLEYLLGLINSKLIDFIYQKEVGEEGRAFAQVKGVNLEKLPILVAEEKAQIKLSHLVNSIITDKKSNPSADTSALEAEIDQLIYELYGLTEEEIRIVEGIKVLRC